MPIAGGPDFFPIIEGRNERSATHRLGNDRGDVALLFQHVLDVIGTLERTSGAALEWTMSMVGRRHVFATGQKRSGSAPKDGFTPDGDRIERRSVKRIPHRNRLE